MDENQEMFGKLVKGLREIYGDMLVSILLYGSLPVRPIQRHQILI